MIEATVRGSLILLAAFAALQVMRHRSAAERELVLRCAILAMLVLSAIAATMHASLLWLAGVAVMGFRLLLSVRAVHKLPTREVRRMGRIRICYNLGARRVSDLRASGRPLPMHYANLVLGSIQ